MLEHAPAVINTSLIHKSGKQLVQDYLSEKGFTSKATREAGAHLVIYPKSLIQVTVRVTTNLQPKPSGGTGPLALDWWVEETISADVIACVDLFSKRIWLFKRAEFFNCSQQNPGKKFHLFMYTDKDVNPTSDKPVHDYEFEKYLFEKRADELFQKESV